MNSILSYIKTEKIFLIILILLHALYFIYALTEGYIYTVDSDEYLQTAVNLKNHGEVYNYFWSNKKIPENYSLRPPVYGIFILTLKTICNSDYFVLFIQNILSIFIWIFLLQLIKSQSIRLKTKWIILITLFLFPTQLIMVNSIMADLLLQLWIFLSFVFVICYLHSRNTLYIILLNVTLSIAVLTKPAMLYFWLPNFIFSFYLFAKNKKSIILVSSLLLPVCCYLWSLRNEAQTGYFHFSSITMQNILNCNAGAVLERLRGLDEATMIRINILNNANRKPSFKLKSEYIISESTKIMKNNISSYIYVHAKGMANFMMATCRIDIVNFFPRFADKEISLIRELETKGLKGLKYYVENVNLSLVIFMIFIFLWNFLLLISTVLFFFNNSIHNGIKLFMLLIIIYIWFVSGPGGYARFKMCILPFMIITVPFFIEFLAQKTNFLIHSDRLQKQNMHYL